MVRFKEYKKLIYKHGRFLYHFTVTLFTIHIDAHINLNPDTICNWDGGCQNASTSPTGAREAPREVAGTPAGDWRRRTTAFARRTDNAPRLLIATWYLKIKY